MMALVTFIPKIEKTGEPLKRWPFVMVGHFAALLFGLGAIFVYHLLAQHTLVWFGLMVIVSFFISLFISVLPDIRKMKRRV